MNSNEGADYLGLLNEPQQKAVLSMNGPVMVIAGAGSGKTRVLTYRIAHLLKNDVDAFNILVLTFTNKAAREMRNRIEKVMGTEARNLWIGTFHSVFAKILRIEADRIGYPRNFTIYDTEDAKNLIKTILKEMALDDKIYKPSLVLGRISNAKNNLISASDYLKNSGIMEYDSSSGKPKIGEIFETYVKRCFRAGAMDFDDLLVKTNELLTKHPDVLNKYQHKFRYALVDEFQDTNHSQYMIVKKLTAVNRNICVVGDDAQSIYAFRGANIQNILNFNKDFPEVKVFKLEQNYRSTQNIVNAASSIIKHNKEQLKKEVWTSNPTGDKIRLVKAISDNEEGKLVAESIFEEQMKNQLYHQDFAILYRTNAQSRSIEEALRKKNIPYRIFGSVSFYQRREVKDLLAYFKLLVNPHDEEALKRVINYPVRGIGKSSLEKIGLIANQHNTSWWKIIEHIEQCGFPARASNPLIEFRTMIQKFTLEVQTRNAYDLAADVAKASGILKALYDDRTPEGISRYENIEELLNGIKEFTESNHPDQVEIPRTLDNYMHDIALITDMDKADDNGDRVSLMTIHSAKGLEFPHVYIMGLEENLFPSQMSLSSRSDLEEERRLFYVAITRAEKKLTLSYAISRFKFGTLIPCEPSRFLAEIDPEFLSMETSFRQSNSQFYPRQEESIGFRDFSPKKPIFNNRPPAGMAQKPAAAYVENPDFRADDTSALRADMRVEHPRFGFGKVTAIEGSGDSRKASIHFDTMGLKQLVLKFARLKIHA
jgi:DNA helicase-2/ATP-dependent DNA helicase PcrA